MCVRTCAHTHTLSLPFLPHLSRKLMPPVFMYSTEVLSMHLKPNFSPLSKTELLYSLQITMPVFPHSLENISLMISTELLWLIKAFGFTRAFGSPGTFSDQDKSGRLAVCHLHVRYLG